MNLLQLAELYGELAGDAIYIQPNKDHEGHYDIADVAFALAQDMGCSEGMVDQSQMNLTYNQSLKAASAAVKHVRQFRTSISVVRQ